MVAIIVNSYNEPMWGNDGSVTGEVGVVANVGIGSQAHSVQSLFSILIVIQVRRVELRVGLQSAADGGQLATMQWA